MRFFQKASDQISDELKEARCTIASLEQENSQLRQQFEDKDRQLTEVEHDVQLNVGVRGLLLKSMEAMAGVRETVANTASVLNNEHSLLSGGGADFDECTHVLSNIGQALDSIEGEAQASSEGVKKLADQTREIIDFVGIIRGISEQTNLLALNAAIEAARAGDQGRGFAVVADEVRALAQRTNTTTEEISTLVDSINRDTSNVDSQISSMQENCQAVSESNLSIKERIVEALDRSKHMFGIVERSFKESFLQTVKMDHVVWKADVYRCFLGQSDKKPEEFADHTQCRLGKWYYEGVGDSLYKGSSNYSNLEAPHREVHQNGIQALQCNDQAGGIEYLHKMEQASIEVLSLLDELAANL